MHVINLRINNFAKLVAVDITPEGNVVTLVGKNMAGKSTVLQAIWCALGGKDAAPSMPVRKGQREAEIILNLGKYIVTRKFRVTTDGEVTTSLAVESADGARFGSPQKLLDGLLGEFTMDPLAFARMCETPAGRRQQYDALASFVPDVNLDDVANKNRGDYEKRTDENRKAKEARAAASVIDIPEKVPERIDEEALVAQMSSATQRESDIAAHGRRLRDSDDAIVSARKKLADTEREVAELEDELADARTRAVSWQKEVAKRVDAFNEIPAAPERIDVSAVAAELNKARDTNRLVDDVARKRAQRDQLERTAAEHESASENLTARIEARNSAKENAIAAAKLPVPGISFGDGEILLNGVPFSQASSGEQIRTSVALAAAMNPKLRVIHIRDGSLLDDDAKSWLAEYAKANDLQVWVEVVGSDSKVGLLIEDGHVVSAAEEKAA